MTQTRRWLEDRRRELVWRHGSAILALTLGLALTALAGGLMLGRLGLYQVAPGAVLAAWIVAVGTVLWGWRRSRSRLQLLAIGRLAQEVELHAGMRAGLVSGVAQWDSAAGSASLAAVADRQVMRAIAERGPHALKPVWQRSTHGLWAGSVVFVMGVALFATSYAGTGRGSSFWHPLAMIAGARGPVRLAVDRTRVARGDSVTVSVTAVGRRGATLWTRTPGEPWSAAALALDSAGQVELILGPLSSDRYLRASSGGRTSETIRVRVALPAFLADLQLLARYPDYIQRPDEPLAPSEEPVRLPVGTRVEVQGRVTVPIIGAAWIDGPHTVLLDLVPDGFAGVLTVVRTGSWSLAVQPAQGGGLDGAPPTLNIIAIPDSVPLVSVPVPGTDTTAPLSLRQPLVIDVRDDYRVVDVELESWRVSRLGARSDPVVEKVPVPEGGVERAVLHSVLDLNALGLLPGDTAFFKLRARDNAPASQTGESRTFALRLPSMTDLRRAVRKASREVQARADSLSEAQRGLSRAIEDLAAERERGATDPSEARGAGRSPDQLPFSSGERARDLLESQEHTVERARQLRDQIRELAETAWSAGLTDPEFHQQLRDLAQLLERALSDEMAERLEKLREALDRLDAPGVREALEDLARAAERLREELGRSRELLERAAIEGDLTTFADEAEELAQGQAEWNRSVRTGADSLLATAEDILASQADLLAQDLGELQSILDSGGVSAANVQSEQEQAGRAGRHMLQAAGHTRRGDLNRARSSGESASEALDPLANDLRRQRDDLREAWRQEVLAAMDRALVETAELARQEAEIAVRLLRGEAGAEVRGAQAANREGVGRVIQRVQAAAGKNALVSPQLGAAMGFARLRMSEVLDRLLRPTPDSRGAGMRATDATDALNAAIYALLRSRSDVAGAQSGSGLEEALERLAQLADQQSELNGESGGLMPLMTKGGGGAQLLQQLRQIAERQRALAQELDRLAAEGQVGGTEGLSDEARDLANQLETGRLDPQVLERQERLFRRLLDAGRTLRSDREDDQPERTSRTADPKLIRVPVESDGVEAGGAPRYRYPTWSELRSLSAEDRRLVLDYFRRLNEVERRETP